MSRPDLSRLQTAHDRHESVKRECYDEQLFINGRASLQRGPVTANSILSTFRERRKKRERVFAFTHRLFPIPSRSAARRVAARQVSPTIDESTLLPSPWSEAV